MENILTDKRSLPALLRDIKRAIANRWYEKTDEGAEFSHIKARIGGIFTIGGQRHEMVQQALERGDDDYTRWLRDKLLQTGLPGQYLDLDTATCPNIIPTAGFNYLFDLLLGSTSKNATWYPSAYRNAVTPDSSWDASWAHADSGPKAQEINASYVTVSARQAATFSAADESSIAMSAAVSYTVRSGISDLGVYGGTLNSSSAFGYQYDYEPPSYNHALIAATRRPSALTGLAEGDLINIAYTLSGTST